MLCSNEWRDETAGRLFQRACAKHTYLVATDMLSVRISRFRRRFTGGSHRWATKHRNTSRYELRPRQDLIWPAFGYEAATGDSKVFPAGLFRLTGPLGIPACYAREQKHHRHPIIQGDLRRLLVAIRQPLTTAAFVYEACVFRASSGCCAEKPHLGS